MAIRSIRLAKLCGLWLFSTTCEAQQLPSLEELLRQKTNVDASQIEVSTSARYQQNAGQSPQVTYLVTDDEIKRFGLRNLGEILSLMPGLYVSTDSSFGYLTARGIGRPGNYNSRLLFLLDGTRLNDNIYDAGIIGSDFFIDTQLIERVEYSPGSGSALYGNNAFLGVVNIITKRGNQLQGAQLALAGDNQHHNTLSLSYGLRHDSGHEGWLALSKGDRRHIDFPDKQATPLLWQQKNNNLDHTDKISGSYRYRRLHLMLGAIDRVREEPVSLQSPTAVTGITRDENRNYFIALQHGLSLTDELELYSHLSTNSAYYRALTPFLSGPATQNNYDFAVRGKWTNLDLRFSYQPSAQSHLLLGVDAQKDHHQSYRLSIDGVLPLLDANSSNNRAGLYLQHDWQLLSEHRLITGFRYDYTAQNVRELSPKVGWVWQSSAEQSLKLSYGTAFRAPNEYEQETNKFFQAGMPVSELIRTLEASWQRQFASGWALSATLYHSSVENMITSSVGQTAVLQFYNDREVKASGVESTATKRWPQGAQLQLSASVQRARYDFNSADLTNAPERLFKAHFSQPLWTEALELNWRLFAASPRQSVRGELAGFARHDLMLSWQGNKDLSVIFGVKNLFDRQYLDVPLASGVLLGQPGRSVELALRWNFFQ
ncbi:TonB-dependent receptor plug domain-containing protein [Rheinheimera sp.]|uniref:TonB-dependent receptor plug domain-containing protein n=1 Tax=Rheinheimera sp. TaxID=1869214 RepID=UPI0025DAE356|nr:TonB-dependent receptor [Rheinheimera sp.]